MNTATITINDYYNENNIKQSPIITTEQAAFLFRLSWLGLATGLIGIYNGKPGLGLSVCVGALLAMNYWRNPVYGLRRTIDMVWIQYLIWLHAYYVFYSPVKLLYFTIQAHGVVFYCVSWYYLKTNSLWRSTLCHGAVHLCADVSLLLFYTLT